MVKALCILRDGAPSSWVESLSILRSESLIDNALHSE